MDENNLQREPRKQQIVSRPKMAQRSTLVIALAVTFSLALHFGSLFSLHTLLPRLNHNRPLQQTSQIKFRVPPKAEPEKQRILETVQQKTEAPDQANYLSEINHRTERETRTEPKTQHRAGAEVGPQGNLLNANRTNEQSQTSTAKDTQTAARSGQTGKIKKAEKKSDIAALLPSANELLGRMNAGYQDFIDEHIELGEAVDINTAEYRYVGYFSSMRKSIELVWNYPYDAAVRGIEGKVLLAFNIEPNGQARHIKVIESSGFKILDDAIVKAIKLASPFAPLPENFEQERLTVKGAFHYRLGSLIGAH